MSHLMPLVDILEDLETDASRADWLLRAPDSVIMRDFDAIRVVLLRAQFRPGVAFIRIRHAALHGTRDANGDLPEASKLQLIAAREVMIGFSLGKADMGEGST